MIFLVKWVRRGFVTRARLLLRWSRTVGYMLVAAAGIVSIIRPPVSVTAASGDHTITYIWAGVMTIAAILCAVGALTGRWVGEYAGLVPLCFVAAVFGISALARGGPSLAGGLFLLGFFWVLLSRWQEVALLRVESLRRHRENGHPMEWAQRGSQL